MEQALMAVSGNMPVRTILTAYTRSPASPFYCRARKSMSLQIRRGCGAIRRRGRPPKPHVALASRANFGSITICWMRTGEARSDRLDRARRTVGLDADRFSTCPSPVANSIPLVCLTGVTDLLIRLASCRSDSRLSE
jgi:hypothetical protein